MAPELKLAWNEPVAARIVARPAVAPAAEPLDQRLAFGLEEEKRRIAQFLHDELGQLAVKVLMDIDWIAERSGSNGSAGGGCRIAGPDLAELRQDVAGLLAAIRGECRDLLPAVLEEEDLPAALEWLGRSFERKAGLRCGFEFRIEAQASPLSKEQIITLFRISQEAMTNVWKHARATRVEISLEHTPEGLLLRLRDDGHGMDTAAAGTCSNVGIRSMKERAGMIGARLSIDSAPGEGVEVSVRMPPASPGCSGADSVRI